MTLYDNNYYLMTFPHYALIFVSSFVRFTNARLLYDRLDERLEWKHGQTYVPKGNKRLLCLVDDINLSQVSWTNKNLEFLKNIHRNIKVNCNFCLISQKRKLNCWKLFYKKCYLVITFIGIHHFSPVRLTCQDSRRLWSWWENTLMTVASTTRTHTRGATSTVWRTAPRSIQTPPLTSPNSARGSWGTLLSLEYLTQSKRFGGFPAIFLS